MIKKYKVITCSQDSRYPQDLVLTLRFDGEAPDAGQIICLVEDAPDLLEAAITALEEMCHTTAPRNSFTDAVDALDAAITKARVEP